MGVYWQDTGVPFIFTGANLCSLNECTRSIYSFRAVDNSNERRRSITLLHDSPLCGHSSGWHHNMLTAKALELMLKSYH